MFVAIIGSHYFEYYTDNASGEESGLTKLFYSFFDKEIDNCNKETDELDIQQSTSKFQRLCKRLKYWIVRNIITEKVIISKEKSTADKYNIKDHFVVDSSELSSALVEHIDKSYHEEDDIFEEEKQLKDMIENDQTDELYFWMSCLNKCLSRSITPNYFFSLNNMQSILDVPTYNVSYLSDNSPPVLMLEPEQINFVMISQEQRINIWKNTKDLSTLYNYWLALDQNPGILMQSNLHDESLSFHRLDTILPEKEERKETENKLMEESESRFSFMSSSNDRSNRGMISNQSFVSNDAIKEDKKESEESDSEEEKNNNQREYQSDLESSEQVVIDEFKYPQIRILPKDQVNLWKCLTETQPIKALEFWAEYLTPFQKIQLWNSVEYSSNDIVYLCDKINIERLESDTPFTRSSLSKRKTQLKLISRLSKLQLQDLCTRMIVGKAKNPLEKLVNLSKRKTVSTRFSVSKKIKDFKVMFFLALPLEEQIKLILYQIDQTQFSVMVMLVIVQLQAYPPLAIKLDDALDNTCDQAIYEMFMALCEKQSLNNRHKYNREKRKMNREDKTLLKATLFLTDKFISTDEQRRDILNQVSQMYYD